MADEKKKGTELQNIEDRFGGMFYSTATGVITSDLIEKAKSACGIANLNTGDQGIGENHNYDNRAIELQCYVFPTQAVEAFKNGFTTTENIPTKEMATVLIVPNGMFVMGKKTAATFFGEKLGEMLGVEEGKHMMPQGLIDDLTEKATMLKSIAFAKVPHHAVKSLTIKGDMEDAEPIGSLGLADSDITAFGGVFETSVGPKNIRFSANYRVAIGKSKAMPKLPLELFEWIGKALLQK